MSRDAIARWRATAMVVFPRRAGDPVAAVHPGDAPHSVAVVLAASGRLDEALGDQPVHVELDRSGRTVQVPSQVTHSRTRRAVDIGPMSHGHQHHQCRR